MISIEDLKKYARAKDLNLWQAEKEYLLNLFLYMYYSKFDNAIFKGGTSFRFFNNLNRFSEDLDFNIKNAKIFEDEIRTSLLDISNFGIEFEIKKFEVFDDALTLQINFKGPLYKKKNPYSINSIRVDAGYRVGTILSSEYLNFNLGFTDFPLTLVKAMNLEERFVEKVSTLFSRQKGRDWYDVFYYKDIIKFNKKLFDKKIINPNINKITQEEYEKDLSNLLSKNIPFESVKKGVFEFLEKNKLI
jgi:uncharacterized protein